MKMTVYELLGLVKDGKAPKKVKYHNENLYFDENAKSYFNDEDTNSLFWDISLKLSDEVETVEEKKPLNEIRAMYGLPRIENNFTGYKMYADGKEIMSIEQIPQEKKIPEKLEDISEIKCVGCKVEMNIAGNKTLFDTDTPIVTEHCIYKINQLIKNQKKIIDYLKSKGE